MNPEDLQAMPPARLPFPVTRSVGDAPALSETDGRPHIVGHFSTFAQPYEVDSVMEGHFMESIAPGAFRKTIAKSMDGKAPMKVLFDHGQDPQMGNMILGSIESLSEDHIGPAYDVAAFDGIPPLLMNGLRAGAYGSSFRFAVTSDEWNHEPKRSDANPDGIPERSITEAQVFEFGPVTFPANPAATAGVRSTTDSFYRRSRDPEQFETLLRSAQVARTPKRETLTHLSKRSLDDLAAFLLADRAALSAAIDKLANGEPLLAQEAELLEAAIEHLEPPDADEDDMQMNSLPRSGAERVAEPPPATTPAEPVRSDTPPVTTSSDEKEIRTVDTEYITRDDKAARVAELRASISSRAVEFTGVLPADVQAADDRENKEHDDLVRDIAAWDKRQERIASFAGNERMVETPQMGAFSPPNIVKPIEDIYDLGKIRNSTRSRDEYKQKLKEHALRSIDGARIAKGVGDLNPLVNIVEQADEGEDGDGEIAQRVLLTGSPAYRRAFTKYLKNQSALWSPEESRAAALAVTGTTTTGGYAVPYVFDPTMIRIGVWTPQNPYRSACRIETITNGNNWRTVTVGAITAAYGTEALAQSEGGPTFGQPTYTVQTASAFATVSIETMEDRPDITSELTKDFAEAKDTLEENQFSVGTGATVYPFGMFTALAYTAVNSATNDVTALSDVTLVETALPLRNRSGAAWFMSRSTLRQLLALDTGWRYFSGAGIQFAGNQNPVDLNTAGGNTGMRLLGYPIWEAPSAVSTLTTDQAILAVLTNPSSYIIVDRIGMNVEVIANMTNGATPSFPTLQRGVLCYWRNTAKPIAADFGRTLRVQ